MESLKIQEGPTSAAYDTIYTSYPTSPCQLHTNIKVTVDGTKPIG